MRTYIHTNVTYRVFLLPSYPAGHILLYRMPASAVASMRAAVLRTAIKETHCIHMPIHFNYLNWLLYIHVCVRNLYKLCVLSLIQHHARDDVEASGCLSPVLLNFRQLVEMTTRFSSCERVSDIQWAGIWLGPSRFGVDEKIPRSRGKSTPDFLVVQLKALSQY
jgi:hypothetical protein